MSIAECLVVIDLHEDGSGDLHAVAEIYRPLPGERIWFSWEDAPAPGEMAVGPHAEAGVATAQPEGRFWVQDTNGSIKTEETGLQPELRTRTLSLERGKYIWNQIDRPMVLMILPPGRPLRSVDPMPMCDGVWQRNHRLCLFWGAPAAQMRYCFSLGSPTGLLAPNAKHWQRRTRRFRPTSRRQVLAGLGIGLVISAVIGVLIAIFGQAEAAVWAGTGAGVVSLFLTVLGLLAVRLPTSGGLSNPA